MSPTEWTPTMHLRFFVDEGPKILQQKWVEHKRYAVTDGPLATPRIVEEPTGVFQWRDVPLVEVKDELAD